MMTYSDQTAAVGKQLLQCFDDITTLTLSKQALQICNK